MDDIGVAFEDKYGVKIEYTYAGSAQNLSQLELSGEGDVYVPGSMYYYEAGKEKGLVDAKKDVAYHIPIIAVPKGNPAGIETLEDLGKDNVKVVMGDEKAAAIGKVAQKILEENGLTASVAANTVAKTATVNELVVYLTMKQADASIIWEDNVAGIEDIEIVEIAEEKNQIKTIPVCTVSNSEKKELAQQFVDFVVSEEGKNHFKNHGFKPVQ
jgi:molybdate transport system substrate-binding protein